MLSLHNLSFGYGPKPLFSIPNLTLPTGENLLIEGNSGSGKTSLLFLIAGLLQPTSGHITVGKTDLQTLSPAQRDSFRGQHIGFIFQQPHLMAPLTVLQNLQVVSFMNGEPEDTAHCEELLTRVGLADLAHRYPAQLSQGQLQRVGIARALVGKPSIVLADEPTSALDDDACAAVSKLLLDVTHQTGASLLVATHDARLKKRFQHTLQLNKAK